MRARPSKNHIYNYVNAAYYGDIYKVKDFVRVYPDYIGAKDNRGRTAYDRAIEDGDSKAIVKYLAAELLKNPLNNSASIEDLYIACAGAGYTDILKTISNAYEIKAGTVNAAVNKAAASRRVNTVKYLVSQGVKVDVKSKEVRSAFVSAGYWGDIDFIKYMTEQGIDINCKDYRHRTAYDRALEDRDNKGIVKYLAQELLKKPSVNYFTISELYVACAKEGYTEILKVISNGCEIKPATLNQAVNKAAAVRGLSTVQYLLSEGARLDVHSKEVKDAFVNAGYWGDIAFIKYMTEQGININCKDYRRRTACDRAIEDGDNKGIIKYLTAEMLKNPAANNGAIEDLYIACAKEGYTDILKVISNGCEVKPATLNQAVNKAAAVRRLATVQYLLSEGGRLDLHSKEVKYAFIDAGYWNGLDFIKYMTEQGIDINCKDSRGRTAYDRAVEDGNKTIAKYLEGVPRVREKEKALKQRQAEEAERKRIEEEEKKRLGDEQYQYAQRLKALREEFSQNNDDVTICRFIEEGQVSELRKVFDDAFFLVKVELDARHLKMALFKENKEMVRFVSTWGGNVTQDDINELAGNDNDKKTAYKAMLRAAGIKQRL